uniref:Uncharacterized protein n=1 Tax=Anopheles culicifacies TaxID=139723 RepID=A0A182M624_9DIPT
MVSRRRCRNSLSALQLLMLSAMISSSCRWSNFFGSASTARSDNSDPIEFSSASRGFISSTRTVNSRNVRWWSFSSGFRWCSSISNRSSDNETSLAPPRKLTLRRIVYEGRCSRRCFSAFSETFEVVQRWEHFQYVRCQLDILQCQRLQGVSLVLEKLYKFRTTRKFLIGNGYLHVRPWIRLSRLLRKQRLHSNQLMGDGMHWTNVQHSMLGFDVPKGATPSSGGIQASCVPAEGFMPPGPLFTLAAFEILEFVLMIVFGPFVMAVADDVGSRLPALAPVGTPLASTMNDGPPDCVWGV